MSIRHHRAVRWEESLRRVFARVDERLESKYGRDYPLHPARPKHGTTASPEADGLFDLGAAFTAGYGSKHGAGYVVQITMATLAAIPKAVRESMEREVVDMLKAELPAAFPGRDLRVERDGPVFKIVGDLSLGNV